MKNKNFLSLLCAGLCGAALMAGLLTLLFAGRLGGFENMGRASKLAAVLEILDDSYIGDYDADALTDAALAAVVDDLDPWSYYMDAETYQAYLNYSANQYQGIGVTIRKDGESGGFLIVELTPEGPAARAGVLAGEIILACDGVDVTEGETAELKALIQEAYGTSVILTLLGEDGDTREVEVSCEVVKSVPVEGTLLDGSVGYVVIKNFEAGVAEEAIAAIEELLAQGAESLVFDVRNNPGGRVTELCELLDYLLPEGDIFIRADKKGSEAVETSDADCLEMPMAVLVNGSSYSAAEFFAAVLREYDWARVIGEATTGKGRSQVTYALTDGSAVHISKYAYLTPRRVDLSATGGLVPDELVELEEQDRILLAAGLLESEADAQLQAALAALRGD